MNQWNWDFHPNTLAMREAMNQLRAEAERYAKQVAQLDALRHEAEQQLAALRQRIADAPVVAWMGEYNINDIRDHYTVVMRHKTDFDGMPERVRALVFKEDLQK